MERATGLQRRSEQGQGPTWGLARKGPRDLRPFRFYQTKTNDGPCAAPLREAPTAAAAEPGWGPVGSRPLGARPPASPTACSRAGPAVPGEPPVLAPSPAGGGSASNLPAGAGGERGEPAPGHRRPRPPGRKVSVLSGRARPPRAGSRVWGTQASHFSAAVSELSPTHGARVVFWGPWGGGQKRAGPPRNAGAPGGDAPPGRGLGSLRPLTADPDPDPKRIQAWDAPRLCAPRWAPAPEARGRDLKGAERARGGVGRARGRARDNGKTAFPALP